MIVQKCIRLTEIALFGFAIIMLTYAWLCHFYGVVLYNPQEYFEHALFWTMFYPLSILLISKFSMERFGLNLIAPLAFILFGAFLFFSIWFLFPSFFYNNRVIFWNFLTTVFLFLIFTRFMIGRFRTSN
jgi:hypothetical protein